MAVDIGAFGRVARASANVTRAAVLAALVVCGLGGAMPATLGAATKPGSTLEVPLAQVPSRPVVAPSLVALTQSDAAFARQQLETAIRLFDQEFRVASSGQYLDAIDLGAERQPRGLSSIAATGIGLISLAMADALGIDPRAAEKAEVTLANLLNTDPQRPFFVDRSKNGWFQQYIDAETGVVADDHRGKYSTIDSSLLAIGATFVARYFDHKQGSAGSAGQRTAALARQLVASVSWESAVRDPAAGRLHALLIGKTEGLFEPYWGELFDEYVLIPCLGRSVERASGQRGVMSQYWDRHVADIDGLPTKASGPYRVLSRTSADFVSHFTHQFAFYLCGDLGRDQRYQQSLTGLMAADKAWFTRRLANAPDRWWGLGAGSALVPDRTRTGPIEAYVASTLREDDDAADVFSPSIMAGFLALDALRAERDPGQPMASTTLASLRSLFARQECVYRYHDLEFLWRCSASDPFRRVQFVQGIDFSTYMLGMASLVPEIGLDFFRRYAP